MPAPERAAARLLACLIAGGTAAAHAQPAPAVDAASAAAACVAITDAAARLACYDRLHGRTDAAAPAPPPAAAAAPSAPPSAAPASPAAASAAAPASSATAAASASPAAAAASAPPAPGTAGGQGLSAEGRAHVGDPRSWLDARWGLLDEGVPRFAPLPHRPVYLLPATWTDQVNRRPSSPSPDRTVDDELALRALEAKFQISLKARLGERLLGTPVSLWGAYTQSSRWQVYNGPESRPFRETNYEPELWLVWPLSGRWLGWEARVASLSLNHQSNGRSLPLSRSWNRVIATLGLERGPWVLELRPWLRIAEKPHDDDNPDIADHLGRGELRLSRITDRSALTLQLRHSLRGGTRAHGSAQLEWAFPLHGALHGFVQVFSGHGESLVDYNLRQTKVGLGVAITGWR